MFAPIEDLYRLAPELVLCAFGILVMLAEPFVPRKHSGLVAFLALLGAGAALAATRLSWAHPGTAFYGLVRVDDFSIFLHFVVGDRKSTRLNSSHSQISYAVFCLKKKKKINSINDST